MPWESITPPAVRWHSPGSSRHEPPEAVQSENENHGEQFPHGDTGVRVGAEKIRHLFDLVHCSRIDFEPRMTMFRANGSTGEMFDRPSPRNIGRCSVIRRG